MEVCVLKFECNLVRSVFILLSLIQKARGEGVCVLFTPCETDLLDAQNDAMKVCENETRICQFSPRTLTVVSPAV